MDDLVVIIITLVIAGFGVLGQIKKQKQNQSTPIEEDAPEDIWEMLKKQMNPPVDEMQQEMYEEPVLEEPLDSYKAPSYSFDVKEEGISTINDGKISAGLDKENAGKTKKSFSLRDAVIYSEILNRKYS
jgi:hypothetical protein